MEDPAAQLRAALAEIVTRAAWRVVAAFTNALRRGRAYHLRKFRKHRKRRGA